MRWCSPGRFPTPVASRCLFRDRTAQKIIDPAAADIGGAPADVQFFTIAIIPGHHGCNVTIGNSRISQRRIPGRLALSYRNWVANSTMTINWIEIAARTNMMSTPQMDDYFEMGQPV